MKVLKQFFDIKQKHTYKVGEEYTGDREKELQDLGLLEAPKKKDKNGKPRTRKK